MEIDLESEPDATCPFCAAHPEFEDHEVQVKPNKNGDPFFHCDRLRSSVNIRENGTEFIAPFVENSAGTLAQPDGDPSSEGDGPTLADVLGGESE